MARRRADRLSILDMSVEDDCLLPGSNNDNKGSFLPRQLEHTDESKIPSSNVEEPAQLAKPPVRKNKNKGHHSLRKSLAWDKAFLTGEGVLDPDELPIVTRSPKKLPDLPTFELNTKRPTLHEEQACKDNPAINLRSFSERFDNRSNAYMAHLEETRHLPPVSSYSGPRILAPKKVIESAIQKGTRLRLPSTFTAEERKGNAQQPAKPPKASSIARRVTSVSRKVKDTLEKVVPGRLEAGGSRRSDFRESRILETDADGKTVSEFNSLEGFCNSKEDRFYKSGSHTKSISVESKPTGLRIPSPKLGFFDPGKTVHASGSTRTAVRVPTDNNSFEQSSKGKSHGLPRGKPLNIRPGIPSGPHVRTTERESSGACISAPSTPSNEVLSSGACGVSLMPKASHKLEVEMAETFDVTKSKANGEVHKPLGDGGASDENNTLICKAVAVRTDRSPLAVNSSLLNSGSTSTGDKSSFFAFAKRAVRRLSSPVDKATPTQENWEAAKVEKLVKTGPVQHSPPDKPVPQPGPWSPVRRNTTQLGPFDCTKSNAQGAGWDN